MKRELYEEIRGIVRSDAGREAALSAVEQGFPALCGVDPLLRAALGDLYLPYDGPFNAGFAVAELMRELGYKATAVQNARSRTAS